MKVTIIEGPHTKEVLQKCYDYIIELYRKEKNVVNESEMTTDHKNITQS
ncbi:hypothetical protein QNH20_18250 [Neobacillus sp. WH10]|nr:hypothetical protein [Neobacillus sp. WH10]WHY76054.1 hypothetical protein QNH20_18250 [Neobacillus sp. WH10]